MSTLYEYNIMKSRGKLCFARGTHEDLIYLSGPPAAMGQLCIIVLSFVFSLFVLNSVEAKELYSLYDLVQIADRQSESIKIAEDDLIIAQQDEKRALSALFPRAAAYESYNRIEYQKGAFSHSNTNIMGIILSHSFTLNGKELIALDIAGKGIESKALSLENIRAEYILQLIHAFYSILSAEKFYEIAKSDVERLGTHKNAVQEKLSVGNVTKTDLLRAQAELSKAITEKEKAKNALLQKRAVLLNLISVDENFTLDSRDIYGFQNYRCSLTDIKTCSLKNRAVLKEAEKNLELAAKTVELKKSAYWPGLSIEAGYMDSRSKSEAAFSGMSTDSEERYGYITGEMTFTLFDWGLRKAEKQQALADKRKAAQILALQKKQIILESKNAFLDYQIAKSNLNNLNDELRYAAETYRAVQMQFDYGMADSVDIMDANNLLVSAQRRISDAKYQYYLSVINILYTKGELLSFLLNNPHINVHDTAQAEKLKNFSVSGLLTLNSLESVLYNKFIPKVKKAKKVEKIQKPKNRKKNTKNKEPDLKFYIEI